MALAHRFIMPSCSILSPINEIQRFGVVHCLATTQTSNPTNSNPITRKSANYKPTIWTYDFVQSLNGHYMDEALTDRANKLEEQVRSMISNEKTELLTKLELIDDIQRLGLAYHFEQDITKALHRCAFLVNKIERTEKNLHATALSFRLLRQHGFEVSQDIFKSFKDENGNFKESLCKDVKGMLSLYEASYLAFDGEDLLDEAKEFTIIHLKGLKDESENNLSKQVSHALELPLHHRMLRLETRWYIEEYSKRSDANQVLLEAAKLDFNRVQSVLQRDLKDMSTWWKGIGLADKLSFSRDRLMECFFWTVGMVYEPQFSTLRKGLTKVTSLITVIDDVYDVYGTLEELELFTDAVERWDVSAVNILPDYMKLCFLALYNTVNEMAYDILKEEGQNILPYLTKAWVDLFKAFLKEKKWCHRKYTPTFEDYFDNAWMSVSGVAILVHAYFLVNQNITKECLECLENHHNLLLWPSVIFRLCNDLGTSSAEVERGESANSIVCSMRQTGNSEESARKYLHNLIEETWKKMNKEIAAGDSPFKKPFLDTVINLARISQCTYQSGDGHGAPDTRSKNRVLSLIINPI